MIKFTRKLVSFYDTNFAHYRNQLSAKMNRIWQCQTVSAYHFIHFVLVPLLFQHSQFLSPPKTAKKLLKYIFEIRWKVRLKNGKMNCNALLLCPGTIFLFSPRFGRPILLPQILGVIVGKSVQCGSPKTFRSPLTEASLCLSFPCKMGIAVLSFLATELSITPVGE